MFLLDTTPVVHLPGFTQCVSRGVILKLARTLESLRGAFEKYQNLALDIRGRYIKSESLASGAGMDFFFTTQIILKCILTQEPLTCCV